MSGKTTLLISYKIVLFPLSRLQLKNSKSEAEVIINKLRCYVQINSVAKLNFK